MADRTPARPTWWLAPGWRGSRRRESLYGLRTLSAGHPQFDPAAYHRGSVWPFDSLLGWGGLRAAGREREAELVRTGVLAAIAQLGDAPELYAVSTDDRPERLPYASRMQAWTVGAAWALENRLDGRVV